MPYPYIDKSHVENRLSPAVVRQIYDDNQTGEAAGNAIDQLCEDASSKVASYLPPSALAAVEANTPHEVIRMATDVAEAYAAARFSSYVKKDADKLMARVETTLEKVRDGEVSLNIPPPDFIGGVSSSDKSNNPGPPKKFFVDGTGIF